MKNSEIKEYLDMFPDDADVGFVVGNPKDRKVYRVANISMIIDMEYPVFLVEVGKEENMDDEE